MAAPRVSLSCGPDGIDVHLEDALEERPVVTNLAPHVIIPSSGSKETATSEALDCFTLHRMRVRMSSLPSLRLRKIVRPTEELDVACNCRKSPTVISSGGTSLAATTTFGAVLLTAT